ncbi:hypothetical protein [Nocardia sp. CA-290969]|uniref:hypothetical protein n=1 Tax=Nocardia sp. CA-290969 TaxID=3239986 RepID=UPI003D8AFCA2
MPTEDGVTAQMRYYADLIMWRQRAPEVAESLEAEGPPPPEPEDGLTGKVLWYEYHPPSAREYQQFLDAAVAGSAITAEDRDALAELPPIDGVAAIRARLASKDAPEEGTTT